MEFAVDSMDFNVESVNDFRGEVKRVLEVGRRLREVEEMFVHDTFKWGCARAAELGLKL